MMPTVIDPTFVRAAPVQHFRAEQFPYIHPVDWLVSHFAVGGWSPLQRLSGMLTAHMTQIAPRSGFTWHPHRGLEIYTWVLEGTLYHEDTTGGRGELRAGDLQRMFSGQWIEHQELNLTDAPARVIQIWFAADRRHQSVLPHYQQLSSAQLPARQVGGARIYSLMGDDSPMVQHVQGRLTAGDLPAGAATTLELPRAGEDLFLYVTDGQGGADGQALGQYDVLLVRADAPALTLTGAGDGLRWLSFYLPRFLP